MRGPGIAAVGCAAIVLAGGSGSRVGAIRSKTYLPLLGRSMVAWSFDVFSRLPGLTRIVLVVRSGNEGLVRTLLAQERWETRVEVVVGGETRHESEYNALEYLSPAIASGAIDVVLVHDGARPCVPLALATRVAEEARRCGGAVPGVLIDERLYPIDGGSSVDGTLVRAQTPQGFRASTLLEAYRAAHADGFVGTDTSCAWNATATSPPAGSRATEPM